MPPLEVIPESLAAFKSDVGGGSRPAAHCFPSTLLQSRYSLVDDDGFLQRGRNTVLLPPEILKALRHVTVGGVMILLPACPDFNALRNCSESGDAHFAGI